MKSSPVFLVKAVLMSQCSIKTVWNRSDEMFGHLLKYSTVQFYTILRYLYFHFHLLYTSTPLHFEGKWGTSDCMLHYSQSSAYFKSPICNNWQPVKFNLKTNRRQHISRALDWVSWLACLLHYISLKHSRYNGTTAISSHTVDKLSSCSQLSF